MFYKLDKHSHEILSKGAVAFVLKIIGAGLAFLFQVAVARYLGASGAGVFFLAITIVTLVATVSRVGIDQIVTRFVAAYASENNWAKVTGVVRHAERIVAVFSLTCSLLAYLLARFVATRLFDKPDLAEPLRMFSLVIAPLALMTLYATAMQGLKRVRDAMLIQSVLPSLIASVVLVVLAPKFGVSGAVMAYGVGVMATLAFGLWMWRRIKTGWGPATPNFSAKLLMKSSFPMLGAVLLQQIMQSLPLLLVGHWGSSAAVGLFGAAQRTALLISLVLIAANIIIAPKFAELYHRRDMVALGQVARRGALLMTAMASPALLVFLVAPKWVMGLYGPEFSAGWGLLVIMALGQLVNVATGSVGFLLVMSGNERSQFSANFIATIINISLCLLLIPSYGGLGAAIAFAASLTIVNLLRVRFVWRTLGIMTVPFIAK